MSACGESGNRPAAPTTGGAPPAAPGATPTPTPEPARAAPGTRLQALDWAGKQRTYIVHAAPNYAPNRPMPLVIAMHGAGDPAETMQLMTGFDAKADREGFIVVYPNGINRQMNALDCCGAEDDIGFLKALIEHMKQLWRVDPDRLYATGISNGAAMSFRLAVELPGTLAAIAPVSGGFTGPLAANPAYKPTAPVSVITFVGSADRQRGAFYQGLSNWQGRLRCPEGRDVPDPTNSSTTRATTKCADGSDVVSYTVYMGHSWPGGDPGAGLSAPTAAVNATDLIGTFFKAHPRRR